MMRAGFCVLAAAIGLAATPSVGAADPPCFDNTNRYVNCGNGTVTDTVTGLTWLQDANCLAGQRDYAAANQWAGQLAHGQCGLTDGSSAGQWRLPTIAEWRSMVRQARKLGCTEPSLTDITGTACFTASPPFAGVKAAGYWSSSSVESDPDEAFGMNLRDGFVRNGGKSYDGPYFVWPVRGGQ